MSVLRRLRPLVALVFLYPAVHPAPSLRAQGAGPTTFSHPRSELVPRIHDLRSLLPAKSSTKTVAQLDPLEHFKLEETFVHFLQSFITPPLAGGEELRMIGDRYLVALLDQPGHRWLEAMITNAKASRSFTVELHTEMLSVPETVLREDLLPLLPETTPPVQQKPVEPLLEKLSGPRPEAPRVVVLADEQATTDLLAVLKASAEVTVAAAPTLTLLPLSPGHIGIGSDVSYVKDYEVKVHPDGFHPEPVMGSLWAGWRIQATVASLETGELGLCLGVVWVRGNQKIPTFTTTLAGDANPITISLPQVSVTQARATVALGLKDRLLVVLPAHKEPAGDSSAETAGKRSILLLRVTRPSGDAEPRGK